MGGCCLQLLWPIALLALLQGSQTSARALTHVQTRRPVIAITINDGPDGRVVPAMLRLLRSRGAKATFFVSGRDIADDPQMLLEIQAAQCEVGGHGYDHGNMRGWSAAKADGQMSRTDRLIRDATGAPPRFFRPPWGLLDRSLEQVALARGERIALWNVGGGDETVHVWPRTLHPGDIIALRDDGEGLRRLRQALDMAGRFGLQPVTLSALLED